MEDEIFDSIGRLITTLQEVAIDERHTPRLYARFLAGLLTKHRKGGSTIAGRLQPHPPASHTTQSHSYVAPRGPSGSHVSRAGMQAQQGPEPRQDSETMQLKLSPMQNAVAAPPSGMATTAYQSDIGSYSHVTLSDGSTSGGTFENNDVSMADVLSDAGTLATMHALNEVWWGNMMMPGCVFPILSQSQPFNPYRVGSLGQMPR